MAGFFFYSFGLFLIEKAFEAKINRQLKKKLKHVIHKLQFIFANNMY